MIEKYYDPEATLKSKLQEERFQDYLQANPHLVPTIESFQQEAENQEELPKESTEHSEKKIKEPKAAKKGESNPASAVVTAREEDLQEGEQEEAHIETAEEKLEVEIQKVRDAWTNNIVS